MPEINEAMPEYTYDLPLTDTNTVDAKYNPADFETTVWDYLGAVKDDTWNNASITGSQGRNLSIFETMSNATDVLDIGDSQSLTADIDGVEWVTPMQEDEQTEWIKSHGMEGRIKPYYRKGENGGQDTGYNRRTLELLKEQKKEDDMNAFLREQAPSYLAPAGIGMMLTTSMLDMPAMALAMGVPVLSQKRMLNMLRTAETASGRTAVRALQGAVSGGLGMAAIEPVLVANKTARDDEWSPWESVLNIGVGAVIGAGLHSAFGKFGEYVRNKRGERQPWQILIPDAESERLRTEFRDGILETGKKAETLLIGEDKFLINSEEVRNAINVLSGQVDVIARTIAYDTNKPLSEVYRQVMPSLEVVRQYLPSKKFNTVSPIQKGKQIAVETNRTRAVRDAVEFAQKNQTEIRNTINTLAFRFGGEAMEFIRNINLEDVQRTFFTGYRRLMAEIARSPESRESARIAYSQMEKFVGAEQGKEWTPAQESRFQNAAMIFFANEKAVPEGMEEAFGRMNQFMREMKLQAENTGVFLPRNIYERLKSLQSTLEERDGKFAQDAMELSLDRDLPEPRGKEYIEGLQNTVETRSEAEVAESGIVEMERTASDAEVSANELVEILKAKGFTEDELNVLVDSTLYDEAVKAEARKAAMDVFNSKSREEAKKALECYIEKMLGA